MVTKVKIKVINEVQTGISEKTGKDWARQDIIVEWYAPLLDGTLDTERQVVTMYNNTVGEFERRGLKVGDEVECVLRFDTRHVDRLDKTFNEVTMYL